jgi:hypothetical protein
MRRSGCEKATIESGYSFCLSLVLKPKRIQLRLAQTVESPLLRLPLRILIIN